MKNLMLTVSAALLLAAGALAGGGNNDAPYTLPRVVQVMNEDGWTRFDSGDSSTLLIPTLGLRVGPLAKADMDDLLGRLGEVGADVDGAAALGKHGGTSTDNGAEGATLTATWHDQYGILHVVTTKKGASEKEKEVVKRHAQAIKDLAEIFPPVPEPRTTGAVLVLPREHDPAPMPLRLAA